jgi:hypothetical protein
MEAPKDAHDVNVGGCILVFACRFYLHFSQHMEVDPYTTGPSQRGSNSRDGQWSKDIIFQVYLRASTVLRSPPKAGTGG